MTRPSSRIFAAMAVVGAALAVSLIGGAGTGHASTTLPISITPLIANPGGDAIPQVSYGGKIGYEVKLQNTDTSNTTHVQVVVDVTGGATFFDATDPSCAAAKGNAGEMICSPFGGTLKSGQTYVVDFRFTAPSSGSSVTATPSVTIAAQTNGNPANHGTTVSTGTPVDVSLNADGSTNDTYLRGKESAQAGGPQNFKTTLPLTLLNTPFGIELGIHNENGIDGTGQPICPTCLGADTVLTIPTATAVGAGTPFGLTNPYTWSMSATAPTNFKLIGVFHIDDSGNGASTPIPSCPSLGGGPTLLAPVCYDTLTSKNKAGVQTLTASGQGLENGRVGFG
jgi:hypothetical protein